MKQILVVEDDPDLAKMLARILDHEGYSVATCEDGAAALHHLDSNPVDLLITDLMMPGMEGEEMLLELRRRRKSPAVPVILISASAVRAQVAERLDVEASLSKPFDTEELVQLVASFLEPAPAAD
jgi:DNA-binding response OmpR family regulator